MSNDNAAAPNHKSHVLRIIAAVTLIGWAWQLMLYVPSVRAYAAHGFGWIGTTLIFIVLPVLFCGISIFAFLQAGKARHRLASLAMAVSVLALLLVFFITAALTSGSA